MKHILLREEKPAHFTFFSAKRNVVNSKRKVVNRKIIFFLYNCPFNLTFSIEIYSMNLILKKTEFGFKDILEFRKGKVLFCIVT